MQLRKVVKCSSLKLLVMVNGEPIVIIVICFRLPNQGNIKFPDLLQSRGPNALHSLPLVSPKEASSSSQSLVYLEVSAHSLILWHREIAQCSSIFSGVLFNILSSSQKSIQIECSGFSTLASKCRRNMQAKASEICFTNDQAEEAVKTTDFCGDRVFSLYL